MSLTGILPLNKPAGMRSTACVEAVRRILGGKIKVGHGGTLDSTASGLLILLIGPATRLSSYIMDMPKRYETVFQLGSETTTDDASGEVTKSAEWRSVTDTLIDAALPAFFGWRKQTPPLISAVRVNGERAHKLARGGKELSINAKLINIIKIIRLNSITEDGKVPLKIYCHKGTYIRSLARDLGRLLGCGAHVYALRRVGSGPFLAQEATPIEELLRLKRAELEERIMSVESLYEVSTRYVLGEEKRKSALNGGAQTLYGLQRGNFGRFADYSGHVVMTMDGIFSVCNFLQRGSSIELRPQSNIFYDGGNRR